MRGLWRSKSARSSAATAALPAWLHLHLGGVRGGHSQVFHFSCTNCKSAITIEPGKKVRLLLPPEEQSGASSDTDDDETAATRASRRAARRAAATGDKAARTQTNRRPDDTVRLIVGSLLVGNGYVKYRSMANAMALPIVHQSTFLRYLGYIKPFVLKLAEELTDHVRMLVCCHGDCIDHLVLTNDFFWATRGHYSLNGT